LEGHTTGEQTQPKREKERGHVPKKECFKVQLRNVQEGVRGHFRVKTVSGAEETTPEPQMQGVFEIANARTNIRGVNSEVGGDWGCKGGNSELLEFPSPPPARD